MTLSQLEQLLMDHEDLKAWRIARTAQDDRVAAELADLRSRVGGLWDEIPGVPGVEDAGRS